MYSLDTVSGYHGDIPKASIPGLGYISALARWLHLVGLLIFFPPPNLQHQRSLFHAEKLFLRRIQDQNLCPENGSDVFPRMLYAVILGSAKP